MRRALYHAVVAGVCGAAGFFALSAMSLFMVGGNGTAPAFTHLMLYLSQIPIDVLGLPRPEPRMLAIAALFWGSGIAVVALVLSWLFGRMVGWSDNHWLDGQIRRSMKYGRR